MNMCCSIPVTFEEVKEFDVKFDTLTVIEKEADVEKYEGTYTVRPKPFEAVKLRTRDKLMTDDVTVTKIPYYSVSNKTGNTVYIGSEVEIYGN